MLSTGSWLLAGLIGLGIALVFSMLWRICRAVEQLDEWLSPWAAKNRGTMAAMLADIARNQDRALEALARIHDSLHQVVNELPSVQRQRIEDEIRRQGGGERPGTHHLVKPRPGETDSEAEARTRAELERKP